MAKTNETMSRDVTSTIQAQRDEYVRQREQARQQIVALNGAIQALERLREVAKSEGVKEHDNGNRTDSDTTRYSK